jgi:hypothetical protein
MRRSGDAGSDVRSRFLWLSDQKFHKRHTRDVRVWLFVFDALATRVDACCSILTDDFAMAPISKMAQIQLHPVIISSHCLRLALQKLMIPDLEIYRFCTASWQQTRVHELAHS